MPFPANVLRVLIASPSDVHQEREIVVKALQEWNDLNSFHTQIVLLPVRWETHSAPELGNRPQEIINQEIVDACDFAIGIFWTRIGTPTGKNVSGTIEEIERVGSQGKLVMLYFSNAEVQPSKIDAKQYRRLIEFKNKTYPKGLVENYENIEIFKSKIRKQLQIKLRSIIKSQFLKSDCKQVFQFGFQVENKYELTKILKIPSTQIIISDEEKVPDFMRDFKKEEREILTLKPNHDYYRDIIAYLKHEAFFKQPIFLIINNGHEAIRNIHIEVSFKESSHLKIADRLYYTPKTSNSLFSGGTHYFSDPQYDSSKRQYSFELDREVLQPKRATQLFPPLYLGSKVEINLNLRIRIYADEFKTPIDDEFSIFITPRQKKARFRSLINGFEKDNPPEDHWTNRIIKTIDNMDEF